MSKAKKNTILIVDDEQLVIQALTSILGPDYKVLIVKDGHEAIKIAKRLLPDIILLDIIMPELDGYDVLAVLKATDETKNIPVIFITGLNDINSEEKALKLGAADYITKPFNSGIVRLRVYNQIKILERYALESNLNVVLKLQSELVAAKEQAEHLSRAKSEFLSRMSHEMLTPMNAINGLIRLSKMHPDRSKKYLEDIEDSSRGLLGMIQNILDISDIEYGVFKLDEYEFSFSTMIDTMFEEASYYLKVKQQKITRSIDASIPDALLGDEKRLNQALSCLLSNAVKFTPENGEIEFKAGFISDDNDKITIQFEVLDNGAGIPKAEQKRIFDIFEQSDGGLTRKQGGIGIGLALSKRIIEMMDGEIKVESEVNKGSKFTFTVKLKKA